MTTLIRPRPIGGGDLVRDYLDGVLPSVSFYRGSPFQLDSFREKLLEVRGRFGRAEREQAARALTPNTEASRVRLGRFVEEGGAMVTTGQQTGFLTGPLYTIYKALSTVALAEHLERELDVVVLPVFWVASEDHDWPEVREAMLLDRLGRSNRFELESKDPRPLPMSLRRADGNLDAICDEIWQTISPSEVAQSFITNILDAYRGGDRTIAQSFRCAMMTLLRDFDLFFTDAADPVVKEVSKPLLRAALLNGSEHEQRLHTRTVQIEDAGYDPQVKVVPGGTNVFLTGPSGRERLYRRKGGFATRPSGTRFATDELLELLEGEPGRFTPNVLLRPVVESTVFPTLAYVGGPGELAYFAQVGAVFEATGIDAPIAVPRFSATVVEASVERVLRKLGLEESDLVEPRERLEEGLARREIPADVERARIGLRENITVGFQRLISEAEGIDEGLGRALEGVRNRALAEAGRAERKIMRSIKRRDAVRLAQLDRVLDALRPGGAPQDRAMNVLPFIARYGEGFLGEVLETIRTEWRMPA